MKKTVNLLSILIIVMLLVQLVCMFLPYFNLTPIADRVNKNPVPTDYSIQQYCWTDCATMNKIFNKMIDDYDSNDYAISLVLTFVLGVISLGVIALNLKNVLTGIPGPVLRVLSHAFSILWVGIGLFCFLTNYILTLGVYPMVWTASVIALGVGAAAVAARLVLDVILGIKAYRAEYCA